ncbi:hypothetical protein BGX29_009501 [Mortierella sp. GBA35]|nr:hypothetical protein BGX29_009501 [Mortierella sp. GBA35]
MLDSGCAGFPLGYPSRADIDINTKYTYLVQDRRPDAAVCQPGRQNIPGNNPFPVASVASGQRLHLTWQSDGHLDDARPSTIEVHWTGMPVPTAINRQSPIPGVMDILRSLRALSREPISLSGGGNMTGTLQARNTRHALRSSSMGMALQSSPVRSTQIRQFVVEAPAQVVQPEVKPIVPAQSQVPVEAPAEAAPPPAQVLVEYLAPASIQAEAVAPAPAPILEAPAAAVAQVQVETSPTPQQVTITTAPFQLAYMTMDDAPLPPSTADAAPATSAADAAADVAVAANPPGVNTLADLSTKADQPLNVVPNLSIIRENRNKDHEQPDGFVTDDIGFLAGDAVNDNEGKDTSPLPIAKPSELIDAALTETRAKDASSNASVNETLTVNGTNVTSTIPTGDNSNTTTAVPASRPLADTVSGKDDSHSRNLASQGPRVVDSAAAATVSTRQFATGAALVSTVLATFTWMLA